MKPLLRVRGLAKSFLWRHPFHGGGQRRLYALDGVDLDIAQGECLALVGESGSGKSTLARCMIRLLDPDRGHVEFDGEPLAELSRRAMVRLRRRFQMVFQDVSGAFDPRMHVAESLAEPLRIHRLAKKAEIEDRLIALLDMVDLDESLLGRYPHQLSGGQRQRLNIARALATEPELLILDEPVSALDMSVRARLLALLASLRRELTLTVILIAHDLAMVEQMADRVAVLYLGRLVELGPREQVFGDPAHPYTASLLAAVPDPSVDEDSQKAASRSRLADELPSAWEPPPGCPFHPRCEIYRNLDDAARQRCRTVRPILSPTDGQRTAACHYPIAAGAARIKRRDGSVDRDS